MYICKYYMCLIISLKITLQTWCTRIYISTIWHLYIYYKTQLAIDSSNIDILDKRFTPNWYQNHNDNYNNWKNRDDCELNDAGYDTFLHQTQNLHFLKLWHDWLGAYSWQRWLLLKMIMKSIIFSCTFNMLTSYKLPLNKGL